MGLHQGLEGHHLLVIEGQRRGRDDEFPRVRIPLVDLRGDAHQPLVFEFAHRFGRRLTEPEQLLQRQLPPFVDDAPDRFLSRRELGHFADDRQGVHMETFTPTGLLLSDGLRQHALEGRLDGAAVVRSNPTGQLQHLWGDQSLRSEHIQDRLEMGLRRRLRQLGHHSQHLTMPKGHLDP